LQPSLVGSFAFAYMSSRCHNAGLEIISWTCLFQATTFVARKRSPVIFQFRNLVFVFYRAAWNADAV